MKNRILLENYFLPGDLEAQIDVFGEHYKHHRYHESLGNMTPAEMAAKSVGNPGWGLTPNPVAITPNHGHQSGLRLY